MVKEWNIFATGLLIFILDRVTKHFAMQIEKSIFIIKDIFYLTFVKNFGVGFGLLQGQHLMILLVSLFVLVAFVYYYKDIPGLMYVEIAAGMILGGTLGNLTDRLTLGYVVDFIDFRIWPVFNIADTALVVGVVLLIYYNWKKEYESKKNNKKN